MRPSLEERRWRFLLFPTLYLSQGLVAGFGATALVNHFVAAGTPLADVGGHLAIVGLPWLLQPVLWGPLVDGARSRAAGRYRFWLMLAILGAQASLAVLLVLGDGPTLRAAGAILFMHSTFASLMDTATDRMIVESVPTADLGRMTACTRAGFAVGGAVGTALFGEVLARVGFTAAATTLLAATSALLGLCTLVRERPGDPLFSLEADKRCPRLGLGEEAAGIAALVRQLARRRFATLLLFCFLADLSLALIQVPLAARLVSEHSWAPETLSRFQALTALVGGTLVTGLAGIAVDHFGVTRALGHWLVVSASVFAALGVVATAVPVAIAGPLVLGVTLVVAPIVAVVLIPYAIGLIRDAPSPATLFQVFMAALNLGDISGAAVAGALSPATPLAAYLLFAAILTICFRFLFRW